MFGNFLLLLCINTLILLEAEAKLCKRMYFEHGKMDDMPYVQLEGIYSFQSYDSTKHPILKHEERDYFFEYHSATNQLYFSQLYNNTRQYLGVKAAMVNSFSSSWWESYIKDPVYPFKSFVSSWYYYDGQGKTHIYLGKSNLYFKCIPDDVFKCTSERLFFNTTITSNGKEIHNHTTDYFSVVSGVVVNYRQVYKHNKKSDWFLFYQSNYWTVGPDYNKASGYLKAFGSPIRPEYLQKNWEYWNGNAWVYFTDPVGLRCRGLSRTHTNGTAKLCSDDNPCQNNARCIDNSLTNETVCLCPDTHKGLTCNILVRTCDMYKPPSSVQFYHLYGRTVNDIATTFCKTGYSPRFVFQQCRYNGIRKSWSYDELCYLKPKPTTRATTPRSWSRWSSWSRWNGWSSWSSWSSWSRPRQREGKKFNFDDYDWAEPVLLTVVCLLQVTIPLVHMFIGLWRDKSACRILSIHAYISFICWLTYYSACAYTKCAKHGKVLGDFGIMSIVMVVLSYLYILIESCLSSENQYVSNILKDESAVDFIAGLMGATPTRLMMIECWHMETRTRTVYYTDANGNTQSRTETYQEKVVTYTEEDHFPFNYCEDISDRQGPKFDQSGVTRLKLLQDVDCGDQETTEKFLAMREDMLERNKHRDVNIDFCYEDTIPGFKKRICAYVDIKFKPWWMNLLCFWLATLLLCSWPFRLLFRWRTTKAEFTIKKRIYLRRPENVPALSIPAALQDGAGFINMAHNPVSYDGSAVNLGPSVQPAPYPAQPYPPSYNEAIPMPIPGSYPAPPPNEPPPDYNYAVR